jgi:hypothetical protein
VYLPSAHVDFTTAATLQGGEELVAPASHHLTPAVQRQGTDMESQTASTPGFC